MKKLAIGLGIVLLIAVFTLPAFGRGPGWGSDWGTGSRIGQNYDRGQGRGMGGYGYGPGMSSLNLTDEQKSRIESLRDTHHKEMVPVRSELYTKKTELQALWAQKTPDSKAILAKQKEISTLRDQMREKETLHRLDMRGILTPEQQDQLSAGGYGRCSGPRGGFGGGHGHYPGFGGPHGWR
ncbi:MAG: Spy/CpxP family protein refolding chaperone [Deltaproteobacteria bacterium]|nr:Spy/CpxP family protein refolding chaperone [Deltaproteobacteria bacterium]